MNGGYLRSDSGIRAKVLTPLTLGVPVDNGDRIILKNLNVQIPEPIALDTLIVPSQKLYEVKYSISIMKVPRSATQEYNSDC